MELLYENGLVHDVADLYDLKAGQLAELPRLGEKSADNIIRSIRGSVEVPFRRVLFGLGIRFVGETTAKYLAEHFRSLDAVMRATREELTQADEVGGRIADAIIEYFADEQNHAIIRRLRAAGLKFEEEARELASESLAGRSFVVSGKFSRSRDEMKELIEMHGGRNLAAVSANVDYIVAGDNMGPAKLRKAEKLGVKIISEEEFIAMVGGQQAPAANGTEADGATTANNGGRNNGAPAAARKAGPEGDGAMPHSAGRKTPEPAATADDAGAPGKGTVDKPEKDTAGKPGENTADKPEKDAAGKPGKGAADKPEKDAAGKPGKGAADKPEKDAAGKPGKSEPETAGRGKQVKPSGKKGAEAAATEGGDGEPVQQGELF